MSSGGQRWSGFAALAATVLLWASFALTVRGIGASSLTTADAALLRFATPALLLAPLLPRALRAARAEPGAVLAALLVGGLPHYLVMAAGGRLTSAGLVGLLVPGSAPVFTALLVAAVLHERVGRARCLALAVVSAGIAGTAVTADGTGTRLGIALLLAAGLAWAVYTVGLRRTALRPLDVVALVCAASTAVTLALLLGGLLPSHLLAGTAEAPDVVAFVGLQGLGTGLLSSLCFAHAVRVLGSGVAAATGALSPVVTVLAAVPLFGETVPPAVLLCLALVVAGVVGVHRAPSPAVPRPRDPVLQAEGRPGDDVAEVRLAVPAGSGSRRP